MKVDSGTPIKRVFVSISAASKYREPVFALLREHVPDQAIHTINTADDLGSLDETDNPDTFLFNFDNGLIIPAALLETLSMPSYNFHSGPPEFPGRDPHHFAIYEGAETFGATLHIMIDKVDSGPIIDVERFAIEEDDTSQTLWRKSIDAALVLYRRHVPEILLGRHPPPGEFEWGKKKYTRADFLKLARLTPDLDREEVERRIRAFNVPGYKNITLEYHDHIFHLG